MKTRLNKELFLNIAIIIGALCAALLIGAILFTIVGANPLKAY
ncbi:hypothetical protein U27_01592 [Candidatus Vecturithrix granuli]|uniref:Uncharacterized protein n=1 Tax=Vecturithrix granuli TaxID=1499967 RepID=A0A0S6W995_VECG1|nr:hypothetical protein U27_01592 [Candidatus Vecturithrix granuli]